MRRAITFGQITTAPRFTAAESKTLDLQYNYSYLSGCSQCEVYGGEGRERAQDLAACTALGRVQTFERSTLAKVPAEPSSRDTFLICAEVTLVHGEW